MSLIASLIPSLTGAPAAKPTEVAPTSANVQTGAADAVPAVTPRHRVTETAEAYGLTVELPGVAKDGLELSVDHEQIRIKGRPAWRRPESWTALHRETREAAFELAVDHGRVIDLEKVHAELRDGVLRVSLPKAGAVKARKIAVA